MQHDCGGNGSEGRKLKGACFLREEAASEATTVVCAFAVPTAPLAAPLPFALALSPAKYGLAVPSGSKVVVTDLVSGAVLGTYANGRPVTYSGQVESLDVKLIKLAVE